jgi:hypothetical protein
LINKYNHPTLAWMLDYWPAAILLPSILILIAVLALTTRWWDKRDAAGETARRGVESAESIEAAEAAEAAEASELSRSTSA